MANKSYEEIKSEFDDLTDYGQWVFVLKHKYNISMHLDNDSTFFTFNGDDTVAIYNGEEEKEPVMFDINAYLGNSEGAMCLLKAVGIKAEMV